MVRAYCVGKASRYPQTLFCYADELTIEHGELILKKEVRLRGRVNQIGRALLLLGQRLLFFPEGTSTDGQLVLPFKTSLFASLLESQNENNLYVQPISIIYHSAQGQNIRTYGWWGDMNFGGHLLKILALQQHGSVEVVYHPPLSVSKFSDRKTLARATETKVRSGHTIRCKG